MILFESVNLSKRGSVLRFFGFANLVGTHFQQ
ncbi:hypothetical protein [Caudoviricetes sp.]|nr:hypothetical protein [Caudoviricetes sp.]